MFADVTVICSKRGEQVEENMERVDVYMFQ